MLPVDEDDEIDLCSDELAEILADGPIERRATKSSVTDKAEVAKDEVDDEDGSDFELNDWV